LYFNLIKPWGGLEAHPTIVSINRIVKIKLWVAAPRPPHNSFKRQDYKNPINTTLAIKKKCGMGF